MGDINASGRSGVLARCRRRLRTLALLGFVVLGSAVLPASASAVNIYYWFTPYGNTDLFNTATTPPTENWASDSVGAGYLQGHMVTNPGGIISDIEQPTLGDYCNYYRLPTMNQPDSQGVGFATGLAMPQPYAYYQEGDGIGSPSSACQADNFNYGGYIYGWGQFLNAGDSGADCYDTCGMQHYVSLAGTSDYPWASAFGDPELTVHSTFKIGAYANSGANVGGWSYMCPILQDMSAPAGSPPRYIEYCMTRWRTTTYQGNTAQCAAFPYNGATNYAPIVEGNLGSSPYVSNAGAAMVTNTDAGAYNYHTFEGTITEANLRYTVNVINGFGNCPQYSTSPADYRLVGVEDGIEGWRYLSDLGGDETNLQVWTAY